MRYRVLIALIIASFLSGAQIVRADETVSIGGSNAVLLRPSTPRASVILMPGGDGYIAAGPGGTIGKLKGNQLVRTRRAYLAHGLAVLIVDANVNLARAVDYMAAIKRPVTVVATSRGTLRAAHGIAGGAKPDALVLTSGFLSDGSGSRQNVANILGSPRLLPRTLVIEHRHDSCRFTLPAGVEPFIRWTGGKARVKWLDGGVDSGDPCQARGHHGFNGLDAEVVSIAAAFR
ncbi:MAG TPA: alpha/beta hydrolase [Pseudolabrys sp.]